MTSGAATWPKARLSAPKRCSPIRPKWISCAKRHGFEVNLVYIHLETDLHVARVIQRVSIGGHDVPAHKIRPRVSRLRANVKAALPLCDSAAFYDNSDSDRPFDLVLTVRAGSVAPNRLPLPTWATEMTADLWRQS